MIGPCDCCLEAMNFPDMRVKRYSMGCNHCAARYMANGGEADIAKWGIYGVDLKLAYALRAEGELIDPELKRKKR